MKVDIHTHLTPLLSDSISIQVVSSIDGEKPFKNMFCYGVHPWDINDVNLEQAYEKIIEYSKHPQWFALGEIGLDKKSRVNFELQLKVFIQQVSIAVAQDIRILVIHSVKSHAEIFKILKDSEFNGVVILHDYNSTIDMAQQYLKHFKTYFSFGHRFLSPSKARKVLPLIPQDKLFLETDDQKIHSIHDIYHNAATLLKIDLLMLEDIIYNNFMTLLKK